MGETRETDGTRAALTAGAVTEAMIEQFHTLGYARVPRLLSSAWIDLMREAFEHDRYLWTGGQMPDVNADPDRFPVTVIETDPGDVVFFHPTCLHQGWGKPVGGPRRTITVRLFGDDVGWHRKQCVYHQWM